MSIDSFDIFVLNAATLGVFWWSLASRNNKIALLEQRLQFAFARQIKERAILAMAKVHLKTYAKAVSMVEMAGSDRIVVTITMNTFARDNLYYALDQLDEYSPDRLWEEPKESAQ